MIDYETELANEFCNQIATMDRGVRGMKSFYLFEDKRPGTIVERFTEDARLFNEVNKLFKGRQ